MTPKNENTIKNAVDSMVETLVARCTSDDFSDIGTIIIEALSDKINASFSFQVNHICKEFTDIQKKFNGVTLICPDDPAQTNLLPLINADWFHIDIDQNLPNLK